MLRARRYGEEAQLYQIEWEDTRAQAHVPRIRLMFCAEDPYLFARHVAAVYTARRETEAILRYNLYVDSMPTDGIPTVTAEQLNRILL